MVQYIKELITSLERAQPNAGHQQAIQREEELPDFWQLLRSIVEEIDRLDPRDFEPAARHDFVIKRTALRTRIEQPPQILYS
jgi:hypothetical protein